MEGYQTLRQLGFGILDMTYHTKVGELENWSVKEFEDNTTKKTQLYPTNPETAMSTSFSHIFQVVILRDIILTNGQKFWMLMLFNISKKTDFQS
jgi:peptidyl-dipeptidase Dcp